MAKPTSRGQTKEVVFPSPERRTDLLIHALNGVGSDNFQDRMKGTIFNGRFFLGNPRSLMVVVKRLQKWSTLKPGKITEGADGFPRCSNEEYMRQLVGLRRLLRTRYVAYPAITPNWATSENSSENSEGWRFEWRKARPSSFYHHLELQSVIRAIELAAEGRIERIRQCASCNKWIYAKFSHQRFCSPQCKEHFHRSDPDDRERRRRWARENYWKHLHKNIK